MVRYDVTAVGEGFPADSAFHVLLNNLSGEQLAHFGSRPDFAISPGMIRIFNTLHSPKVPAPLLMFASTTEKRLVNRTAFLLAELHYVFPPLVLGSGMAWRESFSPHHRLDEESIPRKERLLLRNNHLATPGTPICLECLSKDQDWIGIQSSVD